MYEYKTVMIEGWPDAILNAAAVDGWELVSATTGGFPREGCYRPVANVLWLRRLRDIPADDLAEEPEPRARRT